MYRRYLTGLLFSFLLLPYSIIYSGQQSDEKADEVGFFRINPLNSLSLGWVHLSTTYPVERYTFPNQDGTFADKGSNFYLTGKGNGSISSFIDFNYDLRLNTIEGARFKKGSVFLRSHSVSLEIGRNNIWLGHGQYGSLLLSNNAEPYSLVRFRTERPFRIPYLGKFDYTLFHGWPRHFNILGHMVRWHPASWIEFNIKLTVVYTGRYSFPEYLKMFTAREANLKEGLGETDSRAGFEMAVNLGFLPKLTPLITNAKLYAEYAGEDLYAKWQVADTYWEKDLWVGPFGFELLDTGILTGLVLESKNAGFVIEYAQNYKSYYIFYDPYKGGRPYNSTWYRHKTRVNFQNYGAIMGHHMGSAAEMLFLYYEQTFTDFTASLSFSRRHRWDVVLDRVYTSYKRGVAERQDSFGGRIQYNQNLFSVSLIFTFNTYKNTDRNTDVLNNRPTPGFYARELLAGVIFKAYF